MTYELVVLLIVCSCTVDGHTNGRRLSQAPAPGFIDSTRNVTVAPGDISVAATPDADAPVCPFELHAEYSGAAYKTIMADTLSQCCDSCKSDPSCNAYVYCSRQAGCVHDGQTEPYQQCVLKYQANLNYFSYPPAISRTNTTNFTSGSFPTVQARAPAPAIAFPPGSSANPDLVSLADAPSLAVKNANKQPTCAFENHANYKGDDYSQVNYTFAASLSRCCAFCKASQGCNVYVFCEREEGCLHDGVTEPFQQCVLKYNSDLNTWSHPPAYSRGDDTNFTSGVSTYDLHLPKIPPPPIPPPPSSFEVPSGKGSVFMVQPGSNYLGVTLLNTTADSVASCGATCENTPKCNVFTFCPTMPGCSDGNDQTYHSGTCQLKFQDGLQEDEEPAQYQTQSFKTIELSSGTYFAGQPRSGPRTGAVVGGILGAVAFVALLVVLAVLLARRMRGVRSGRRSSLWSWRSLEDPENVIPNFKLMRSQDILDTGQGSLELSRLPTLDCQVAALNDPGPGVRLPRPELAAPLVLRRQQNDKVILTARTVDHRDGQVVQSYVPVFEGDEDGMRIVDDVMLQDIWKIDPSNLTFLEENGTLVKLGEGGHGVVYKGKLFGNTLVAIKSVQKPSLREQEDFAREIIFLKACRHPNIVQFIGASEQADQTLLIMEFMPGDLYQHIKQDARSRNLSWYRRGRSIAMDICCGLTYLHSHRILHLDIKSPNILLSDNWSAKISDIGLGRTVTRDQDSANSNGASKWWASPEQMLGAACTAKADVYGLGSVIWELCTGLTIQDRCLRSLRVPAEAPQEIEDLICACRANSAQDRPSAAEVHAIITNSAARAEL